MSEENKDSICINCVYGSQPHGYFPIFCVFDAKHIKVMWHNKYKCKHFDQCPNLPEPEQNQKPFQIIKCKKL